MRRLGFALVLLAAVPALALPLLAGVVVLSVPAALIAAVASIGTPHHATPVFNTGPDHAGILSKIASNP